MSGLRIISLGKDIVGQEYWKFPISNDLYISSSSSIDNNNENEMSEEITDKTNDIINNNEIIQWKKVTDLKNIQKLIDIISLSINNNSDNNSQQLIDLKEKIIINFLQQKQKELQNELLKKSQLLIENELKNSIDNKNESTILTSNSTSTAALISTNEDEITVRGSTRIALNNVDVPIALRLLKDKGQDVQLNHSILEESIFEDDEDLKDQDGIVSHLEYFTFTKRLV